MKLNEIMKGAPLAIRQYWGSSKKQKMTVFSCVFRIHRNQALHVPNQSKLDLSDLSVLLQTPQVQGGKKTVKYRR